MTHSCQKTRWKRARNAKLFKKNKKNSTELATALSSACEGLIYISETDAPVVPFSVLTADAVNKQTILQQTGSPAESPMKKGHLKEFFTRLTTEKDWFGEPEWQSRRDSSSFKSCSRNLFAIGKYLDRARSGWISLLSESTKTDV